MNVRAIFAGSLFAVGLVTLGARPIEARPEFPAVLEESVGLECAPSCRVCHTTESGGIANLERFGEQLQILGAGSSNALRASLRCLLDIESCSPLNREIVDPDQNGVIDVDFDSDADGVTDPDELRAGTNPSRAGAVDLCSITYGCGARIEPRSKLDGTAALTAALAAFGLIWSARRRR